MSMQQPNQFIDNQISDDQFTDDALRNWSPSQLPAVLRYIWEGQRYALSELAEDKMFGWLTLNFFANNWDLYREGLARKTRTFRVVANHPQTPNAFYFELDRSYKAWDEQHGKVVLKQGPIHGVILYNNRLFSEPAGLYIHVSLTMRQWMFHPNCCPDTPSTVCIGQFPECLFPVTLDMLVENHLYPILTYQNMGMNSPLNSAAAHFFSVPGSLAGLLPVQPLY